MESGSSRSPDEAVTKPTTDVEKKGSDIEAPASATSGSGRKSGGSKYTGHSILNSVNKSTLQIKKPPHRKSVSPLNWFPRKKTDSFLKRKIKHLQEIGGMNISLDETLGNANPHYTRIAREKIAAQEAAQKAMEARKAAMVEASWCRILGAARIKSKEAEARLGKAEECAAEAFEAARAMGVMMYDRPDCQRRPCEIQTSLAIRGQSTHTVTASFETAFEVDKEVAAAVKRAFVRLANCPSSLNKEEFKDLLCKISQNPDTNGTREDLPEISSECETDPGAELDYDSQISGDTDKKHATRVKQRKHKNSLLPTDGGKGRSISPTELNDTMLDRLKGLQEDELASLAVIVATCGLNAALREMESSKDNDLELISSCTSTLGTGTRRYSSISCIMGDNMQKKEAVTEVPSLDKFLVKHVSRLEREVQEAKRSNVALDNQRTSGTSEPQIVKSKLSNKNQTQVESTLDLGTVLVKHVSKLEKDILESKKNNYKSNSSGKSVELNVEIETQTEILRAKSNAVAPSSDNIPILGGKQSDSKEELLGGISEISHNKVCKQFSSRGLTEDTVHPDSMVMPEKVQRSSSDRRQQNKENIDLIPVNEMHQASKRMSRVERAKIEVLKTFSAQEKNRGDDTHEIMGLDKILVKPIHRLEKEKMQALEQERDKVVLRDRKKQGTNVMAPESLDTILVKHVSRLEKDKLTLAANEGTRTVKKCNQQSKECVESLDEILVKHQSKLEKAELAASQQSADYMKHEARREARERELQEAWGGLSLGNSLRPHLSRIERDKAAWRKAEEEERMREVEP